MKDDIMKDKSVLYKFVKSYFTGRNNILYARILQISQELAIEGELKSIRKQIIKLLIKYTRRRFRKFMKKTVKRHKMADEGFELIRSIVLEYVWFYRMTDILKKIFFSFNDFGEFTDKIKHKINKIVSKNNDALVDELGKSIYRYEVSKDDPSYSFIMTETEDLKLDSSKNEFSEIEFVILILEIFKDIDVGPKLLSRIIEFFMNTWIKQALIEIDSLSDLNKRIESLRKNVVLSDHLHVIENKIIKKLFENISSAYLLLCLGFKENLNYIEYYFDLIEEHQVYDFVIDDYIDNRHKNITFLENEKKNFNEIIIKINEKLKNENNPEKKMFITKLLDKIQGITKMKMYQNDTVNFDSKFGDVFRFWVETLAFKNEIFFLKNNINKRFEKYINEHESVVVKSLSKGINDILSCKIDVLDVYRYVSYRELCNIDNFIGNEFKIFCNKKINISIICCDLLCPISVVLNEFSVKFDILEENDVMIFLRKSIFKFVGDVFSLLKDKDGFELALRKNLAERLFSKSSLITEEEEFLSYCVQNGNKVVSSKLETMINDYKERFIFNNCEVILLKKFQWPEYNTCNLSFDELDQEKKIFSERLLKNERKRLFWVDSLSSCDVEINGRILKISLIQYKILNSILETGTIHKDKLFVDYKILYKLHFEELIQKKLIITENLTFKINTSCTESDFVPKKVILKEQSNEQNNEDDKKFKNAQLDCKIMGFCKKSKSINIKSLSLALKLEKMILIGRLEELKRKGYLDVVDEDVLYVP